jgi:hypothetical protein
MTKPDYTELDAAILQALARPGRHTQQSVVDATDVMANPECSVRQAGRLIERRLQALRRAAKVAYSSSTGWQVVGPPQACQWPACPHGPDCVHAASAPGRVRQGADAKYEDADQFREGEVWESPRGTLYRCMGFRHVEWKKRRQAMLSAGVDGKGRITLRDWDDVIDWVRRHDLQESS